jgi:ribosome-associated protein
MAAAVSTAKPTRKKTSVRKSRTATAPAKEMQPAPVNVIAQAMLDKKAEDVIALNLTALESTICDHFVIGHGRSATQVLAIADNVEREMYVRLNQTPRRTQGRENAFWIILDYTDIVVHVFQEEYRRFYRLEALWDDALRTAYDDTPKPYLEHE